MTPSLERLDRAIVHLDTLIGLYLADVLRGRLATCEDPSEQAMIVGLVRAYHDVWAAKCGALGFMDEERIIPHDGALIGEIGAIIDRERRWSENAGYQRGRSDEVAARISEESGPIPRARRRPELVTVEPHRALW